MRKLKKYVIATLIGITTVMPLQAATLTSITQNNTTLVPLRVISQELKASIDFDAKAQSITIIYKESTISLKLNSKETMINGKKHTLTVVPAVIEGVTYVPLRFIGEALGAEVDYKDNKVTITLDGSTKSWMLQTAQKTSTPVVSQSAFKKVIGTVKGKSVKYLIIDMNDAHIQAQVSTAGGKINQVVSLKEMSTVSKATAGINGTYFAAYNGDMPMPDGTVIKDGKLLHITDIGCTVGFTKDNKVLIDLVTTRAKGYINGEEGWISYRVNRPTPDASATVIFTPEYVGNIPLGAGQIGIVCQKGKVIKKVNASGTVPTDGFILVMQENRGMKFNIGDEVYYETTFLPANTSKEKWADVTEAISAGPSLLINGIATSAPAKEGFTEEKILTQVAQRSFIGTTADNKIIIGTTVASINEMKTIAKELGLINATCLDGGASSGIYYNNEYMTSPGRNINNSIQFIYVQ